MEDLVNLAIEITTVNGRTGRSALMAACYAIFFEELSKKTGEPFSPKEFVQAINDKVDKSILEQLNINPKNN